MYIINKRYEKYIPKDFDYEKLGSRFDEVYKYLNSEEAPVESNGDEVSKDSNASSDNEVRENENFMVELITNLILADMLSLQKISNDEVISLCKFQVSILEYITDRATMGVYSYEFFHEDPFSDLNFIIKNLAQLQYLSLSLRKSVDRENLYLRNLGFKDGEGNIDIFSELAKMEFDTIRRNIEIYKKYRFDSMVSHFDIQRKENEIMQSTGTYGDIVSDDELVEKENHKVNSVNHSTDRLEKFIQDSILFARVYSLPIQLLCYVLLYNLLGLHNGRTVFGVDQITNIEEFLFRKFTF